MTETLNTTTTSEEPAPELSGVDLARVALHQACEAAKARGEGGTRKAKRRIRATVRRDGRAPTGFAAVLQGLMAGRRDELRAGRDQVHELGAVLLRCNCGAAPPARSPGSRPSRQASIRAAWTASVPALVRRSRRHCRERHADEQNTADAFADGISGPSRPRHNRGPASSSATTTSRSRGTPFLPMPPPYEQFVIQGSDAVSEHAGEAREAGGEVPLEALRYR